jgi:hypothetical protein
VVKWDHKLPGKTSTGNLIISTGARDDTTTETYKRLKFYATSMLICWLKTGNINKKGCEEMTAHIQAKCLDKPCADVSQQTL